jgi:hypothetical protein
MAVWHCSRKHHQRLELWMTRSDVTEDCGKLCSDDAPARGTGGSEGSPWSAAHYAVADSGFVDAITQSRETRKKLIQALAMVEN